MTPVEAKALLSNPNDNVSTGGAGVLLVSFKHPGHHMALTLNVKDGAFSIIGEVSVATHTLIDRTELMRRAVDFITKAKLKPRR